MTTLWRINIKPDAKEACEPAKFCINKNILAVGWPIDTIPKNFNEYWNIGKETYGYRSWTTAINAIRDMENNDLCWTRDEDANYYLGRITSDWFYKDEEEYEKNDCHNLRGCKWYRAGNVDSIPGHIVNTLARGTVSRVHGGNLLLYSKYSFNELSHTNTYSIDRPLDDTADAFFSLIQWDDCEDLLAIYLQKKGYILYPSTCKLGTKKFEFILMDPETKDRIATQVKNSGEELNINDYKNFEGRVYLFSSKENYIGEETDNVICLNSKELYNFCMQNQMIMSPKLKHWIQIFKKLS